MNAYAASSSTAFYPPPFCQGDHDAPHYADDDSAFTQLCLASYAPYAQHQSYPQYAPAPYASYPDKCPEPRYQQEYPDSSEPIGIGYPIPRSYWPPQGHTSFPADHTAPPALHLDTVTATQLPAPADIPIYSPVPISGNWPILTDPSSAASPSHAVAAVHAATPLPLPHAPPPAIDLRPDLLEVYANAPRAVFPTPSDLLRNFDKRRPAPLPDADKKGETQRKVRQRIVAEAIGFPPTDPDTISSHDKKRYYLECLEQYVSYLHEQLHLVGQEPVPLERVSTYRGLTSRSIRTMMVNMQGTVRKAHEETLEEERNFLELRAQVLAEGGDGFQDFRRHSTSTCASIPE
ncbi:hypothetical protein FA95DRAFT_1567614 [Auriscalpium vulgare]|uniref:Uncharacterized protein n=1 Tax=Auriscalpium vulgare TaxID=40419 RepID=A0ACB8R520_9AGAM|nr:hypothetical protein FA95DRAFT_1567614 [Auriscalpium vulgare]